MCRRPPRSTLTDPLVPYSAPSRALRIPVGPAGGAVRQANRHVAVAIPENDRIFHPRFEVAGGDELQVDVQDGLAEEADQKPRLPDMLRSDEHTSDLQSLMRNSYALLCLKKTTQKARTSNTPT